MGATDYVYGAISNVSTNAFDITNAVNSGDTSGTEGAYIPAAKVVSSAPDSAEIASPSAGNIQISYVKVYYTSAFTSNFDLTMPQGINNGVGANTNFKNQGAPIVMAYAANGNYNSSATPNIESNSAGSDFDIIQITAGLNAGQINMIVYQF